MQVASVFIVIVATIFRESQPLIFYESDYSRAPSLPGILARSTFHHSP